MLVIVKVHRKMRKRVACSGQVVTTRTVYYHMHTNTSSPPGMVNPNTNSPFRTDYRTLIDRRKTSLSQVYPSTNHTARSRSHMPVSPLISPSIVRDRLLPQDRNKASFHSRDM